MRLARVLLWLASSLMVDADANGGIFDYVIVGGGTTGLLVANRLSENSDVTVAVIEPGGDARGNPNSTDVEGFLKNFGTSIDWDYTSTNQTGAANRSLAYHAGKAIGGTSTINGMTYIRADKAEIDAWESLGNPGWNWDTMWPYYTKVENFSPPTAAQLAAGATYDPAYHGETGLLKTAFPYELVNGSLHEVVQQSWASMGYPRIQDVNGGSTYGFDVWPQTVNRDADTREDAARAYYWPFVGRPNLRLFQGTVTRLTWGANNTAGNSETVANGVEYVTPDGTSCILEVGKEVILAAGSLRTPLVLEASGVGNPELLNRLGIDVQVNLPGVGENLQDQPNIPIGFKGKVNVSGTVPYGTFVTAADLFGSNLSTMASTTKANLSSWASMIAGGGAAGGGGVSAEALEKIYTVQWDLIFNKNVTIGEILTTASGSTLVSAFWYLLPFSRGSVHLGSVDKINEPVIDPNFFAVDFDLAAQVEVGKISQEFWTTQPVNDLITEYILPGPSVLPWGANDTEWRAYIPRAFSPNYHPLGTAAMMAEELGGVVGPDLKVYGTRNVRIVDASVIPYQLSGHLTATLYALAERAAEMIKGSS